MLDVLCESQVATSNVYFSQPPERPAWPGIIVAQIQPQARVTVMMAIMAGYSDYHDGEHGYCDYLESDNDDNGTFIVEGHWLST